MLAKGNQAHSNEHRSGFIRRLLYFTLDPIKSIFQTVLRLESSNQTPFIYLRGDESSHFHERGNKHDRWHIYPAYGMDIIDGCMPNKFSHILFGKLKSLSKDSNHPYRGDRIYIKPEKSGLQQFRHYIAHSSHYIRAVSSSIMCRFIDRLAPKFCKPEGTFHEWIDHRLIKKWTKILNTINDLTHDERRKMQNDVFSRGILEIYRQTLLFPSISHVNDFRIELEQQYGSDICARKGNEVIFTTEQLLDGSPAWMHSFFSQESIVR
ncbi:unnamed protein product [Adineta steineri]|uniref:Uncharacterized protein n=1 Tax=Adineta steineri TaxID=433720 RepID=A0A814GJP0_9BILA|nr:unnamed protein product [Adineta steineri]CAF1221872.1 unnamed protein product [Adineta steineri]